METFGLVKTIAEFASLQTPEAFQSLVVGVGAFRALLKAVESEVELELRG